VYSWSSEYVCNLSINGDADDRRQSVYGHLGERYRSNLQFYDSRNRRNADPCYGDRDADYDNVRREFYLDQHGQYFGDASSGRERPLYIFGDAGWGFKFQFGGEFCVQELARIDRLRI